MNKLVCGGFLALTLCTAGCNGSATNVAPVSTPKPTAVKAPAHAAVRHAAPVLADNPGQINLLTAAQVVAKIPSFAVVTHGVLSSSRLISFSAFDPEFQSAGDDSTIGPARQIWELTYVFPNGVTMSRGQLAGDAKAIVAYDAATGAYLAGKWTGTIVRRIGGPR
jgi:hypothetical protein